MRSVRRALVLGGTGFIGSWLVDVLQRSGIHSVVVDRRPPSEPFPEQTETIVGEIGELDLACIVGEHEIDTIFQLAGTGFVPSAVESPVEDLQSNAVTTVAALEALRRVERPPLLIFISSAAVYGEGQGEVIDETHALSPISPYGVSKLAAENYVRLYVQQFGVRAVVARLFSVYGPRQRKLVVYDLLTRLLAGEDPLRIAASEKIVRDFVYVEDATASLVTLAQNAPGLGEAYNIASGKPVSLQELTERLVDLVDPSIEVEFTGVHRVGDPNHWQGDGARARAIGVALPTSLEQGLELTLAWLTSGVDADKQTSDARK